MSRPDDRLGGPRDQPVHALVAALRRRREAAWRLPPTRGGHRDPLDSLGATRRRRRRVHPPMRYVDHAGNLRDEAGTMLRSRLDTLLDARRDRDVVVPGPREPRHNASLVSARPGGSGAAGREAA